MARIRRDELLPEVRAMFAAARAGPPKLGDVLQPIRRAELARAHALWCETIADRGAAAAGELLGLLDEDDDVWRDRARRALLQHGVAPEAPAIGRTAEVLIDAHQDGAEMALAGRPLAPRGGEGAAGGTATRPEALSPALEQRAPGGVPFDSLLALWQRERRPSQRTVLEFTRAMRRLGEQVGHEDGARLTRDDIAGFRDALLGRVAPKSAFNQLAAVRAVLGVGVSAGKLASNAASGVTVKKGNGRGRLPFTDAEAALILEHARGQRGGRRWVPWLLAFTGARLEEVCQAHVSDIRQEGGVWYLDINAEHGALKNDHSARRVPLHPALIAEGFLDYVKARKAGPLFPDFKPDTFGRRGGTATKVLGRALRKLGIDDPRKVAGHSWRHRFKDLCRAAGVEKAIHDALTGHASSDVGDGYGLGYPLPVLAAAVEKLPAPL